MITFEYFFFFVRTNVIISTCCATLSSWESYLIFCGLDCKHWLGNPIRFRVTVEPHGPGGGEEIYNSFNDTCQTQSSLAILTILGENQCSLMHMDTNDMLKKDFTEAFLIKYRWGVTFRCTDCFQIDASLKFP